MSLYDLKDELKVHLGEQAKVIIAQGLNLYRKGNKVRCPLHNDTNPSMSWFADGLMYRCHACGGYIDIYSYYMDFQGMNFNEAVKEVANMVGHQAIDKPVVSSAIKYTVPNIKTRELSQPYIDYMLDRKISKATLDYWRVKEYTWFNKGVYVFQYFNEQDKLEYVSYRGLGSGAIKGGCVKNTKSILWGMWHIDKSKPVVIVEGQLDAMSVWQSGYKNVVSVPAGSNNLQWIDSCWEWLQALSQIVVFADSDAAGLEMAQNIQRKLQNVRVLISERNDANEVLLFDGPEKLIHLIDGKLNEKPDSLIDLADINYKSAMEIQGETIETGFKDYDAYIEDWKMEELTIIFGRNGEGKTTFISQIISHCIERGTKTFLYSGEMSEQKIQTWLYTQLIGSNKKYLRTITAKYRDKTEPDPEIIRRIKNWHKGKLFLYNRKEIKEEAEYLDKFFRTMDYTAKRFGVKLFIIDNLMSILEEDASSLYSDQANFVQKCKLFAINNKVHVVLLAHPNKDKKELKNETTGNLDKTDISGSNNIGNKADNIIAIERVWSNEVDFDAIVTSLKNRETGQRSRFYYYFSKDTSLELSAVEASLINVMARESILKLIINDLTLDYDFILIDCPASLGLLTINALTASDKVIIPVTPEYLSAVGLELLLHSIFRIKRKINPHIQIEGILFTMYSKRLKLTKEIYSLIKDTYGNQINIFDSKIPASIRVGEANNSSQSILEYNPKNSAAMAYIEFAREVLINE